MCTGDVRVDRGRDLLVDVHGIVPSALGVADAAHVVEGVGDAAVLVPVHPHQDRQALLPPLSGFGGGGVSPAAARLACLPPPF